MVSNARTETLRRDNVDGLTDQVLHFSKKCTEIEEAATLLAADAVRLSLSAYR